jgi:two-component system sensor histidine kinase RpfC
MAIWDGYYHIAIQYYVAFFAVYLVLFLVVLISVIKKPVLEGRRYFSLTLDITGSTLCIFMTESVVSPFYLLYIWIFISYGTRFGKKMLKTASIFSIVAYVAVATVMDQWDENIFEISFFLLLLVGLPFYQYSLLKKLHQAKKGAELSSRVKSTFLSNMTDELRAPLNSILNHIYHVNNKELTSEQRDHVESIFSSVASLDLMIGGVLDFTRAETGKLELEILPFRVGTLLLDVCTAVSAEADIKRVELICQVDREVPAVMMGDELHLQQVLFSLMASVLGVADGGEIKLSARLDEQNPETVLLEIERSDSDSGVTNERRSQVFDAWHGPPVNARRAEDVGLGTALANNLVALMGGEIVAQSAADGSSLVQIRLPLSRAEAEAEDEVKPPNVAGVKALVYEGNSTSLEMIVDSCGQVGINTITVQRVADLTAAILKIEGNVDVDLAIIADSPEGQDMARIAAIFRDHLDADFPVLFLGYRRSGLELSKQKHTAFLRKPFMPAGLAEAAFKALYNKS